MQQGSHNAQLNLFVTPGHAVSWPVQVGVLPPRADKFQDRPGLNHAMAEGAAGGALVLASTAEDRVSGRVLSGLGGVGKTQLAAEYARHHRATGQVDLLVWISATTAAAIQAGYARAAARVEVAADGAADGAHRFLEWLHTTRKRWLVVLDDLTDPADLRGWWPPSTATGQTLITTRRRDAALAGHGRVRIDVGLFTADEALAYLTAKLAGHHPDALDEAAELAKDLGWLPLALSHATAYIANYGLTCATYRRRLGEWPLVRAMPCDGEQPDADHRTVAATWSLSIRAADRLVPPGLAQPVLELAGLLDPNGISLALLAAPPTLAHLTAVTGGEVTAADVSDAVHNLHRLSLVTLPTHHDLRGVVRVHALVQRVVREHAAHSPHQVHSVRAAAAALLHLADQAGHDPVIVGQVHANTTALHHHAPTALWNSAENAVLFRSGSLLGEIGQVTVARDHFQALSGAAEAQLGADHPDTLATRSNLAYWRGRAGDPPGAATAFEHLLVDRLRVLGPDHHHTLATRSNLAYWRGEAWDPTGAVTAFEHLLADCLRILGPDHPHTLATRSNIARWRGEAGDPTAAAIAFEHLHTDCLRILGPDHPYALTTRSNIARWRGEAWDPAGAAAAFEQLLVDRLRILGPDHPHTLATRSNIAHWRGHAGDPAGAAVAFEWLLVDRLRVLGADHPDTLATRSNSASWRGEAGDPAGAAVAFEELLADRLRVLGPDHPDTLVTRSNLVSWRGEVGDPAVAVTAFEELLADQIRVLGPDHPHTLTTRGNLASWRARARCV